MHDAIVIHLGFNSTFQLKDDTALRATVHVSLAHMLDGDKWDLNPQASDSEAAVLPTRPRPECSSDLLDTHCAEIKTYHIVSYSCCPKTVVLLI